MFDHYRPAFNRCSPFFRLFRRPALGRAAEKWKKRRKGLREGTFLVAKQSLRWGRPSGGETKSTDRLRDGSLGSLLPGLFYLSSSLSGAAAEDSRIFSGSFFHP